MKCSPKTRFVAFLFVSALVGVASAEMMDRPVGVKIGQRMTLRPYVSFGFTYDSNHDQQNSSKPTTSWTVNPAIDLDYKADNWNIDLNLFYGYRHYDENQRVLNSHSYGESLRYRWSNTTQAEKGWSLMLTEEFRRIAEDDDMQVNNGRGLWRDRQQFDISGALQRRITESLHADVNASYYYLDYDNDEESYAALYGWQRWVGGLEFGYAASKWTDILIAGSYQRYYQENDSDLTGRNVYYPDSRNYSHESEGWTISAGLGSWMTDRISYRLLGGWSYFNYGDVQSCNGFVYQGSLNWRISETWRMMLLASSHFQPSEREYGSANRVDMISWGVSKSLIRNSLGATLDLAYRRETREVCDSNSWNYDEDIFSARLGLNYRLNRYFSIFGNVEYQGCWFDGDTGLDRDYNRFRGTVGFRLAY